MTTVSIGTRLPPVRSGTVDGRQIDVFQDTLVPGRYWTLVDGAALFQRGRMRLRTFASIDAAWRARERS